MNVKTGLICWATNDPMISFNLIYRGITGIPCVTFFLVAELQSLETLKVQGAEHATLLFEMSLKGQQLKEHGG